MAEKDKAPKTEKVAPKGRNNMVSSRKDFDKVYAEAIDNKESPEFIAKFGHYLTSLAKKMSGLGWEPKPAAPEAGTVTQD